MTRVLGLVYLLSVRRCASDDDPGRLPGGDAITALGLTAPPRPPDPALPSDLLTLGLNDASEFAFYSKR